MIGHLTGSIIEKTLQGILLNVAGVGYEVAMPLSCVTELPALAEMISIYTHFVVREDAMNLYGFMHRGDRELFRALIKVNGVGPKLALGLLSALPAAQLLRAIEMRDIDVLTRLPGIGKRTAEKLVVAFPTAALEGLSLTTIPSTDKMRDAIAALVELGYKPKQATDALRGAENDEQQTIEMLIKLGLKQLANVG